FALTRDFSGSDEVARALTFSVLVLSNLGLIYANRSWNRPALLVGGTGAPEVPGAPGASPKFGGLNPTFLWMALATLSLLAIVLAVPAVRALFSFAQPSPQLLLAGCGAALLSLVWFEAVKWGLRPRAGTAA
ncbi:MAG: cation transporting ATPase C-terminal domain-containing protein, partial [Burkholderiaceae bacterium]|nr:cation transporting ATPase C-terminal domain-containing protein [Burkholderiaceae bacterium]